MKEDGKYKAAEKGLPVLPYAGREVPSTFTQEMKDNITKQEINSPHTIEDLYTTVKKPKDCEPKMTRRHHQYHHCTQSKSSTQLSRKSQSRSNADGNRDETPLADDKETAPPIPPHTVEELYTAVMKKPKGNEEDEKEAPPIPPYI